MKLENKVAIVTGGGKGIGAEICLKLAKRRSKNCYCRNGY